MVTQSDVKEFRKVYQKKFGIELGAFEARTKLELLVRQMELVYQPITKQQLQIMNVNEYSHEQSKSKSEADTTTV